MKRSFDEFAHTVDVSEYRESLDDDQNRAFTIIVERRAPLTFVNGPAGVGKSHVMKAVIGALRANRRDVAVMAPTGVAAVNLGMGATTLHRFFGITKFDMPAAFYVHQLRTCFWLKDSFKAIRNVDVIVVDEVSMLSSTNFDMMDTILREVRECPNEPMGGVQLILCGDLCQIGPVKQPYVFTSRLWSAFDIERCPLGTQHRQDGSPDFAALLNRARFAQLTADDMRMLRSRVVRPLPDPAKTTRLFYMNVDVDAYNQNYLKSLDEKTAHTYTATVFYVSKVKHRKQSATDALRSKSVDYMLKSVRAPERLELRLNARVMLLRNLDVEQKLANGELGTVVGFTDDDNSYPIVEFERAGRQTVEPFEYKFDNETQFIGRVLHFPLMLAWGLTIHKCQSATLSSAVMDLRAEAIRGKGLAYTALSRVRSLDTVWFVGVERASFDANEMAVELSR